MERSKKTNYGKIFAIMFAFVVGVCAVMWFGVKLYRKYCLLDHEDAELDGFDEDDDAGEKDCEVVMDTDAEENTEEEKPGPETELA